MTKGATKKMVERVEPSALRFHEFAEPVAEFLSLFLELVPEELSEKKLIRLLSRELAADELYFIFVQRVRKQWSLRVSPGAKTKALRRDALGDWARWCSAFQTEGTLYIERAREELRSKQVLTAK